MIRKLLKENVKEEAKEVKPEVKEEVVVEEKVEEVSTENDEFSSMTLADLKAKAKDAGVKGYSTMKKAELIEALTK